MVHRAHAVVLTMSACADEVRRSVPGGDQENGRRRHDRHVDKQPRDRHRDDENIGPSTRVSISLVRPKQRVKFPSWLVGATPAATRTGARVTLRAQATCRNAAFMELEWLRRGCARGIDRRKIRGNSYRLRQHSDLWHALPTTLETHASVLKHMEVR